MTVKAIALVDGEHYPDVVRDALAELPHEVVAAVLVGGTEKLRGGEEDYGVPLLRELDDALEAYDADVVVDLSDEPVLGPADRMRIASRVLAGGIAYEGADFRFTPPPAEPISVPALSVVGTGKRVGKTAVATYAARLLAADRDVVVVAMGRGGPREPVVVDEAPTLESLLELSRRGSHAASDYLEDAVLAGVVTVGCRRCGGGLAGATVTSNVAAGAHAAAARRPDLVVFEGSGTSLPAVATDRRVLVVGAHQRPDVVTGYLNAYRILVSDLVVLTMAENGSRHGELAREIQELKPDLPVVPVVLRPHPVEPVDGRRVAYFSTAPESVLERLAAHLADEHGADVVQTSGNLARRDALREEVRAADADVFLVELKAAAIDVVAEAAVERGIDVVFCANDVEPIPGAPDLDAELRALADAAAIREPAAL